MVQLFQIGAEVLHPQCRPLAHRHRLGGLVVGVAQGRGGGIPPGKGRQIHQNRQDLPTQIPQTVPVEDQVGVVRHIAAGGPQMDDPRRGGGRQTVGVDMGHHVMADFLFPLLCGSVVDVGDVGFQLRHLLCGDGQTQLVLRPGQLHPQPPPGLEPHIRREQVQHIGGGIAGGQGGFVNILAHKGSFQRFSNSLQEAGRSVQI